MEDATNLEPTDPTTSSRPPSPVPLSQSEHNEHESEYPMMSSWADPDPQRSPSPSPSLQTDAKTDNINDSSIDIIPAAHSIIHLIQCPRCSLPLKYPLRLPCGYTLCRSCLPPVRPRIGITYPVREERVQGFSCYWGAKKPCSGEHCLEDCGVDVLLSKLVGLYGEVLGGAGTDSAIEEEGKGAMKVAWKRKGDDVDRQLQEKGDLEKSTDITRGQLLEGVYDLVKRGEFEYDATDVVYEALMDAETGDKKKNDDNNDNGYTQRDRVVFEKLKENLRNELDCQVCYALILEPLTTPCGHTFCRKCVARVLDHSDLCPICRRKLNLPPSVQSEPVNRRVARLVDLLYPEQIAARRDAAVREEAGLDSERTVPLFVCALTFPTMPTFLHIFEPRYRLMIRRVMDSGGGKFGMLMYNRSGEPQGELGASQFMQYGTMLMIDRFELLPDGRSLVLATGLSRFKVLEWSLLDGYHVGKIKRVDDVSLAEEESLEATETMAATIAATQNGNEDGNNENADEVLLESMSTQQLLQMGLDFVHRQRANGATWLQPPFLMAYPDTPTDPVKFPWWLASVLRISEEERYPLLLTTSVRERLKITAGWARKLERKDRYVILPSLFYFSISSNSTSGSLLAFLRRPAQIHKLPIL